MYVDALFHFTESSSPNSFLKFVISNLHLVNSFSNLDFTNDVSQLVPCSIPRIVSFHYC